MRAHAQRSDHCTQLAAVAVISIGQAEWRVWRRGRARKALENRGRPLLRPAALGPGLGWGDGQGPQSSEPHAGSRTLGVAGFQRWALTSAFKAPTRAAAEGGAGSPPPRPHPRPRALRAWGVERGAQRKTQTPRPQARGPGERSSVSPAGRRVGAGVGAGSQEVPTYGRGR